MYCVFYSDEAGKCYNTEKKQMTYIFPVVTSDQYPITQSIINAGNISLTNHFNEN